LPAEEIGGGRPPFLLVVDVGHSIALYTDWSRAGGHYVPFPDPARYRLRLEDLRQEEVRALLRTIWTDPLSLDPSRRSARVTREIADRLARLARSLEGAHPAEAVAQFLMRCLFTMFAEDVGLLPAGSFTQLLTEMKAQPAGFAPALQSLWESMDRGGFSPIVRQAIPRFNGGLFAQSEALPLNPDQIQLLVEAAEADWRDVEPAIFGTLLERALDPRERHKLGAHYTPRAYVERLVQPTVIQPLRAEWAATQAAALQLAEDGQEARAIETVQAFLRRLAQLRILDPACGSGNFLYVTLELLKRLEGEVLNLLRDLGHGQISLELGGVMVTPANLLGLEINPRAAAIAELVLWIGFLQWQLRQQGDLGQLPEPIIRDLHNIECRDAVLSWSGRRPQVDKDGQPVTRWDGRSTRPHPVTGEEVPDPEARVQAYTYHDPAAAEWPDCDFIVGNPPFLGKGERMRAALGDGYIEALRQAYPKVPGSVDFVMYWWFKAGELARSGQIQRFGFITTNSISQTFNRRVIAYHLEQKKPLSLVFAIPDHPWVDSTDGAAVRIAMTVAESGKTLGQLQSVLNEHVAKSGETEVDLLKESGSIFPDLSIGADVSGAKSLRFAENLHSNGMMIRGSGFIIDFSQAEKLGLGR
ncbi:MAG: class I SAM-dependent DNA methyltransferase, partial [Bacteroidetes bacterium]